jgi:hypothetical protein
VTAKRMQNSRSLVRVLIVLTGTTFEELEQVAGGVDVGVIHPMNPVLGEVIFHVRVREILFGVFLAAGEPSEPDVGVSRFIGVPARSLATH